MPALTVEERRHRAVEASGGISSEVIYDRIIDVIREYDLKGRALDCGAGVGNLTSRLLALGRFQQIEAADILPGRRISPPQFRGNIWT
jgi:2-polyprenyl-3-methyl-5-hydroxy-6-metoxy-1,4-benzoquinol methylase